ncbi:MAG TPA: hypothetical protein VJL59_12125 [Anaerolineales bacterium]|nr:hypothetical protein [Anaerolineales bacterium]
MSQLILMIAKIDDLDNLEVLTEVWRRAMPVVELNSVTPEHYLDGLESAATEVGWEAMRNLMVEQWRLTDTLLVERFRQEQAEATVGDGYDSLKVASRLGVVHLPRQVCYRPGADQHTLPGNAGLPEHGGQVTTRGLQEWVCLLPQSLPFGTAERLLGWMAHDPQVMSETQSRRWVSRHGQIIRKAEQAEVKALEERENLAGLKAQLCPARQPRRPAAWAVELNQAVETALAQPEPKPPAGITASDWERVIQARQAETNAPAEDLRRLGPQVQPGEVIASVDEVVVRRPEKRRFLELGTAYVRTAEGCRYLSGSLEMVLRQLFLLLRLCGGSVQTKVLLLGDGARWIMRFFQERLATWPAAALILDWYHCRKKCYDLTSLICRGRKAKAELLGLLLKHLWRGQVQDALDILEEYRPLARNIEKLDELINYLSSRREFIPNYRERRAQRQYIGSAHVEKGNDLIVARRQKHQGMHWSEQTSDALAALRTLMLNDSWDLYWQKHQVLPLAIQAPV